MDRVNGKRMLSLALRRGYLCMLYFEGQELCDWRLFTKASNGPEACTAMLRAWQSRYSPEIIVSQNPDLPGQKGALAVSILSAIANYISDADVLDILIVRTRRFDNIYEESVELARRYPVLKGYCPPKPRCWESEPRAMIYFEALAMARQIFDNG